MTDLAKSLDALRHGDEPARRRAVEELGASSRAEAISPLLLAVGDETWTVRQAAIEALAGFPPGALLPTLEAALRDGDDAGSRNAAMEIYIRLGSAARAPLLAFLSDCLAHPVARATTVRQLAIDGALSSRGANQELMELLDRAGPYGPGHPEPRFVFPAHRLARVRAIKDTHFRCTLQASDGGRIEACAFRVADTPLGKLLLRGEGLALHLAGRLRRTSWQGRDSVELLIEDAADPRQGGG